MRIIMFGTGPFAVPTFQSLLDSNHELLALVTRPIEDAGKRRKTSENPTRDVAENRSLAILDPPDCNQPAFVEQLKQLSADLFVVCDYGQILSRDCLAASRLGGINLHGSLLPKYRGAAPINWAIYHGDSELGVTIIHMTAKLDGGPCLAKASLSVSPTETAADVEPRLATLGVQPVFQAIEMLQDWDGQSPIGEKQDPQQATQAPRLKKSDGLIDWTQPAIQIFNQIRAFQPWPGSYTHWHADHLKQPMRIIVHRAAVCQVDPDTPTEPAVTTATSPGQVAAVDQQRLLIQTGIGLLELIQVQPAGKKAMPIADFLRGHQPKIGQVMG